MEGFIDDLSGVPIGMDWEQHQVHSGNHFYFSNLQTALDSGDISKFAISIPDSDHLPHFGMRFNSGSKMRMEVYETVSYNIASAGDAVTIFNNKRSSGIVSRLNILRDPVVTVSGDQIFIDQAGNEETNPAAGSSSGTSDIPEFILKKATVYIFAMISVDADNYASVKAEWDEKTSVL